MSSISNPMAIYEVDSTSQLRDIELILVSATITFLLGASVTWFGPKQINLVIYLATLVSTSIITKFSSYTVVKIIPFGLALIVTLYKPLYKTGIFFIGFSSGGYAAIVCTYIVMAILTPAPNAVINVVTVVCGIASLVAIIYGAVRALEMNASLLRLMICSIGGFTTSNSLNYLLTATIYRNVDYSIVVFIVVGALLTYLAWRYQPVVEMNYQIAEIPAATPNDEETDYVAKV